MAGFLLIATVLVSRPLISESYRAVELSFLSDMHVGAGPSASLTAWLDLLLLIGAAAAAFGVKRGAIGIAAVIGFFTLIFAVALSSYAAADKRLALDAGFTLIAFAAVAVTALAQQWRKSLIIALLAGVSASGVTFAVKCFLQVHSEFPELVRQWDAQQAATPTDAPYRADRVNFERRLRAMEPFGYQSHSNVAGSLLAMWGLLAVGAAASRWTRLRCKTHADNSSRAAAQDSADRSQFVAVAAIFALVAGVFAWALVLTGSFGAVISGIFGLVTFATLLILHRKRGVSRRHALTVILAPYLLLIVIGATIGLSRGTLPHPSMAFRWGYWQGAARVYAEEPWRGIGRENFGDRYLHAKNITSPEDVKDPHNFWISMLIELGPLGLVASGLLVIAGLWVALPRNTVNCDESSRTVHGNWTAIALAFATLSLLLATNRQVFSADSMWIVWLTDIGFPWMASYAFFWWILSRTAIRATPDNFVTLGAVAAAVAVLYHNLVSFSLLVPGG
ncbi:MAG: O-antigen ligase family protein, partial [Phycisphaerae bacterium]